MEMSFEDIIKFLDSLIVPIIVGILSAGLTIYIKNKEIKFVALIYTFLLQSTVVLLFSL